MKGRALAFGSSPPPRFPSPPAHSIVRSPWAWVAGNAPNRREHKPGKEGTTSYAFPPLPVSCSCAQTLLPPPAPICQQRAIRSGQVSVQIRLISPQLANSTFGDWV